MPVAFRGDLTGLPASDPVKLLPTSVGPRDHGPRRRDGRCRSSSATPRTHEFGEQIAGHRGDRGVAARRPAEVRPARDRRDRDLQARPRPVRRRRPAPARGAWPATPRSRSRTPASTRRSGARPRARRRCSRSRASSPRPPDRSRSPSASATRRSEHPREPEHVRSGSRTRPTERCVRLAGFPEPAEDDGLSADPRRASRAVAAAAREPYTVDAERLRGDRRGARGDRGSFAIAPFIGRRSLGRRRRGDRRRSRPTTTASSSSSASIARQTRLALQTAASYETLERTFLSTVEALANALEAKDEYTSHARALDHRPRAAGRRELGLEPHELKRLELGALFHDIGKIGIPSRILAKPGPLTRRGARARRDAPDARRAHPRADRAARRGAAHRPLRARALRRHGLPGPSHRRADPARVAHRARLRRLPRDDHRPAVPQVARRRTRRSGVSSRRRARSSTRRWSTRSCACSVARALGVLGARGLGAAQPAERPDPEEHAEADRDRRTRRRRAVRRRRRSRGPSRGGT